MSETPKQTEPTAGWIERDVKRVFWIGIAIGVPLGWVTLPFFLWALGMTMEFHS